jgi:hypothetical protein
MSPTNQINFVFPIEFFNDIATKQVTSTSWTHTPTCRVIWVTPHQVTHGSIMWNFLFSIYRSYLIQGINRRAQPSMHTENFVVDDGRQSQIIKYTCTVPPHVYRAVLPKTLIIEPIDLCYLSALVISSYQRNSFGVTNFQSKQKQKGLY